MSKITPQSVVEYYESIGMSARVLRHDSFEDVQSMAIGVDSKAADALYGTTKASRPASDGKSVSNSVKRKPAKHPKKGSAEAKEHMAKLRAKRGKSSSKQKQKQETTEHENTEQEIQSPE